VCVWVTERESELLTAAVKLSREIENGGGFCEFGRFSDVQEQGAFSF
jgi:hypothetical protein